MKVKELIAILEDMDADANVLIASQPSWPFEYALAGVAIREDVRDDDEDADEETQYRDGCYGNDVLLAEGRQLRYGSKATWEAARR